VDLPLCSWFISRCNEEQQQQQQQQQQQINPRHDAAAGASGAASCALAHSSYQGLDSNNVHDNVQYPASDRSLPAAVAAVAATGAGAGTAAVIAGKGAMKRRGGQQLLTVALARPPITLEEQQYKKGMHLGRC
jgi:hypothetical protein